MRIVGSATALVVVAALAMSCGAVIDGTAKPAPNLKPRPLRGKIVRQVLLDDVALSGMLSQPFVARVPPEFGGPDKLIQPDSQGSPAGCLGVTEMLQKRVYESAEVKDVASESWWNNGEPAQVISVMEGVVTLPTSVQAEALFAKFSDQWQRCSGMTTTEQTGPISTTNAISDVRVADASKTIVAATNTATAVLPNMPPLLPTPQARAIGVRLNCLVEVEVVFFGDRRPSDPGSADLDTSAVDIAHAMMDKISALS
jgi:PknH-like extracellular domain